MELNFNNNKQLNIENEKDLHYQVIESIRKHFPKFTVLLPGLGEYQTTSTKRIDGFKKGYSAGQPDLIIPISNGKFNGIAFEFKSPNGSGTLKNKQQALLSKFSYPLQLPNYCIK